MAEFILLGLTVLLALLFVQLFPAATERWYRRIARVSGILWKVIGLIVSIALLTSGSPTLVAIGAVGIVMLVLFLAFDTRLGDRL